MGTGIQQTGIQKKISCPALVQIGAKDSYVLKSEIDKVFTAIFSTDKKLVGYENADHESLCRMIL